MTTAARPASISATLRDLVALTKPRITLMVVITTAGGLWLAPGEVGWQLALATIVATAMVVGAANALNCWLERDIDGRMARTKRRPLPDGRLDPRLALGFGLSLGALSVPILTMVANPLTGLLAAIALVSYVWIYTPMKQRSPFAVVVGSVPGALPPLIGWTAATGELSAPGIVLFGILFIWQLPHFLAISIVREREYTKAGIVVMSAARGVASTKRQTVLWAGALLPVSLLLVPLGIAGWIYLTVAAVLGVAFLVWALLGLRKEAGNRWARQLFLASLAYLPLLFAALAVDVAAGS
ncbi:MAG TPA: heme o synthase [Sandaracinaceae bacterium]